MLEIIAGMNILDKEKLNIEHYIAQSFIGSDLTMARNKLVVPGSEKVLNQMKEEIANEFGVTLGADTTARANGSVGGEMTKRLVALAEQTLAEGQNK
ncbi:small, acid-soluble spore protein B [Bacillus sp. SG-1]|nr:small, acid-soluble spore protein B [Bacillus sp. SG-1]